MSARLIRIKDFTCRLGVGRSTFFAMKKAGLLPPPVRVVGRVIAWRETDVDLHIATLAAESDRTNGGPDGHHE